METSRQPIHWALAVQAASANLSAGALQFQGLLVYRLSYSSSLRISSWQTWPSQRNLLSLTSLATSGLLSKCSSLFARLLQPKSIISGTEKNVALKCKEILFFRHGVDLCF